MARRVMMDKKISTMPGRQHPAGRNAPNQAGSA
jgi:hypothetical protein